MRHPLSSMRALVGLAALLLVACGGGGGTADSGTAPGGPGAPAGLAIVTSSLPAGSVGSPYAATQLVASGVQGQAVWSIDSGSLPTGLDLGPDGMVSGTPSQTGSFPFVARVDDDVAMDTRTLVVSVDVLGVSVTSGLTIGDAWSQRGVRLVASGNAGSVTYSATTNASGGSFTAADPVAGTATWTPGTTAGPGVVDELRASDTGSGQTQIVTFRVMPNPAAGHVAEFGSTDVWYIDPEPKDGTHAYASDFHDALVTAGFRDPGSTGATGTRADQLAALYIRLELLRLLNPMFLRNADGTSGAQGLPISFPLDEPGAGYAKAAAGDSLVGSPTRYSVMALIRGSQSGVIGTAFIDGTSNGWHENDTTAGTFELGVFANQIVPIVNSSYSNPLPANPIDAADVPALEALLYELPNPGGRYTTLRTQGRALALALAATVAHEIGHSVGLAHTDPPETGSIMNATALIGPGSTYSFTNEHLTQLGGALPGSGKSAGAAMARKTGTADPKPIEVCHCRGCAAR